MNYYIEAQVCQVKAFLKTFETACEQGVKKNDGKIEKEDAKELKRIRKAVKRFTDELDHI